MKKRSFQAKLTILFVSVLISLLTITMFFVLRRALIFQKAELRATILGAARWMSRSIDADKLVTIRPEQESEKTEVFKEIRTQLLKFKSFSPFIDSIYTMVKSDKENIWLFLVDSGDKRKAFARCGEAYDVSDAPDMKVAFQRPSVDRELTTDKWGIFLSSYAPIYNKDGQAVAIIAIDVRADSIKQMQFLLAMRFLFILAFGIILSIILGWFFAKSITEPINRLMLGVRELGKGNLNYKVDLHTKDELEELAGAFNKMSDDLRLEKKKLGQTYIETIKSLVRALEAKDLYTSGHSERVAAYAINIAKRLGLPEKDIKLLEEVSILHDIGKIGMPENILSKDGPLSKEEMDVVKQHPKVGEDILKPIEFLGPGLSAVSDHHERQDGTGYPRGLRVGQISIFAAIAAVADSYDAMTSDRPYRKALSKEEAIAILEKNKEKQFNRQAVDALIEYLRSIP